MGFNYLPLEKVSFKKGYICTLNNTKIMNTDIRQLSPQALWNKFADLNAVPRASKKEAKVIAFMVEFGKHLGLETIVDEVGNVIIKNQLLQEWRKKRRW